MRSPGINGEGELRGQPANPGSPRKWPLNGLCVFVCVSYTCNKVGWTCHAHLFTKLPFRHVCYCTKFLSTNAEN